MDFNIVKRQIIGEYLKLYGDDQRGKPWNMEDCLNVFRYYYRAYREKRGVDHPHLSNSTIRRIIEEFPKAQDPERGQDVLDLEPQDYPDLIQAYFSQHFDDCNYSIAHFMSGNIRALRFYEELY